MKKPYISPECEKYTIDTSENLLGMSVYDPDATNPVSIAGDGDDPTQDDDGIIWNDSKWGRSIDLWGE